MKLGIDFGTTNSAVSAVGPDGTPRPVELVPGERVQRSVIHAAPDGSIRYGNAAFAHYVATDLRGRLLRSLKAFLPQDVPSTSLSGKPREFHELVSLYLQFLLRRTQEVTGQAVTEVVVGRPVRFSDRPEADALALSRLHEAIAQAGITRYRLQLEPVAAAHRYEHGLSSERIVLVGDFGGGTSDFAVLRVGPRRVGRDRLEDVLGTSGVPQAGDALDGRFMDTFLMGFFGRGTTVKRLRSDERIAWVHPIQRKLQRLYYLHLLRDKDLRRLLTGVEPRLSDPMAIRRILRLIFDDLGFPMAWAIERTKRALSAEARTAFVFDEFADPRLDIATTVDLDGFRAGSAAILDAYVDAIGEALDRAGLGPDGVDDVFLTGGTSNLPFVRGLFVDLFGADKLRSADAFTSVSEGLALA